MIMPILFQGTRRLSFALLALNGLVQAGTAISVMWLIRHLIDSTISKTPGFSLISIGSLFLVLAIASIGLRTLERHLAESLGQDYLLEVRQRLFGHLGRLSPRTMQRFSVGSISLRFGGDMNALRRWISLGLARLIVSSMLIIGIICTITWMNPPVGGGVSSVILLGVILSLGSGRKLWHKTRLVRKLKARMLGNITEKIMQLSVVQVCGQSRRESRKLKSQGVALADASVQQSRSIGTLRGLAEATVILATGAVLILGTVMLNQHTLSTGSLAAILVLTGLVAAPIRDLGRVHEYWYGAAISRKKIVEFLQLPTLRRVRGNRSTKSSEEGLVTIRNVFVNQALSAVSAEVQPGTRVAIVGPNGSGKSTLLALISRLVDPDKGRISVNGTSVRKIGHRVLSRNVGMVGGDFPLLRGTLLRNIRYRNPRVSDTELQRVIKFCQLQELVDSLPKGLMTRLSEGGKGLSSGERQRIVLARALLDEPSILLLDEADTNLDATASAILEQLLDQYHGTILMVSHQQKYVLMADQVWYLQSGKLVEQGTPTQLFSSTSRTAKLFASPLRMAS